MNIPNDRLKANYLHMKIKKILAIIIVLTTFKVEAQYTRKSGNFELGMRQTLSLFGNNNTFGYGTGGQFRLMMGKRLNTEWFADYIQTDLYKLGKRTDGHIGWSVMFYMLNEPKKLDPYLIAGHCFDYTKVRQYNVLTEVPTTAYNRWSSAVQAGIGTHYYIGERCNLTLAAQYMLHLGTDIHVEKEEDANGKEILHIDEEGDGKLTFEGHLLVSLSLNFKIGKLW
jgi:hypothetical protein